MRANQPETAVCRLPGLLCASHHVHYWNATYFGRADEARPATFVHFTVEAWLTNGGVALAAPATPLAPAALQLPENSDTFIFVVAKLCGQ